MGWGDQSIRRILLLKPPCLLFCVQNVLFFFLVMTLGLIPSSQRVVWDKNRAGCGFIIWVSRWIRTSFLVCYPAGGLKVWWAEALCITTNMLCPDMEHLGRAVIHISRPTNAGGCCICWMLTPVDLARLHSFTPMQLSRTLVQVHCDIRLLDKCATREGIKAKWWSQFLVSLTAISIWDSVTLYKLRRS